jgi:hypothetical protein
MKGFWAVCDHDDVAEHSCQDAHDPFNDGSATDGQERFIHTAHSTRRATRQDDARNGGEIPRPVSLETLNHMAPHDTNSRLFA